jgi:hypothetical protein
MHRFGIRWQKASRREELKSAERSQFLRTGLPPLVALRLGAKRIDLDRSATGWA